MYFKLDLKCEWLLIPLINFIKSPNKFEIYNHFLNTALFFN